MKPLFLLLLFTFILGADPIVTWNNPTTHDFGDIDHKKPVQHEFSFTNISEEPFVIDNVRVACGCTSPDWPKEPILPDSTATITIEFDAEMKGYFYKWIKVYFSNQRKAEKLYIEGFVEE